MKKRHWMYLLVILFLGLAVFATQRGHQKNLAEETGRAEKEIAKLQADSARSSREPLAFGARETALRSGGGSQLSEERKVPSEARVEAATTGVEAILKSLGGTQRPSLFMKALPNLLGSIEDLTGEELLAVVARMDENGETGTSSIAGEMLSVFLLSLAAETSSEGLWERLGEMKGKAQAILFSSLAKKEPEAATQWLQAQNLPGSNRMKMAQVLISRTLKEDPIAALRMIRELGAERVRFQPDEFIRLDEGQVSQLEAAFDEPNNEDLRKQIADVLLTSASSEGVASLTQQAERLNLEGTKLLGDVLRGKTFFQPKEAKELLNWLAESLPDSHPAMSNTISRATGQWADRDFSATAEWLGELKPSQARDAGIEGFVESVAQVDPEAAAQWALEVRDPPKRQSVLAHAMKAWRLKDATAADAWSEVHGGQPNEPE